MTPPDLIQRAEEAAAKLDEVYLPFKARDGFSAEADAAMNAASQCLRDCISALRSQRGTLRRIEEWTADAGYRESGIGDGPEVDTYEDGYESAQLQVAQFLAAAPSEGPTERETTT